MWDLTSVQAKLGNLSGHRDDFVDWGNSLRDTLFSNCAYQVTSYPSQASVELECPVAATNLMSTRSRNTGPIPLYAETESTSIIFTTGVLLKFFPALPVPSIPCAQTQKKQQNRIRSVSEPAPVDIMCLVRCVCVSPAEKWRHLVPP